MRVIQVIRRALRHTLNHLALALTAPLARVVEALPSCKHRGAIRVHQREGLIRNALVDVKVIVHRAAALGIRARRTADHLSLRSDVANAPLRPVGPSKTEHAPL